MDDKQMSSSRRPLRKHAFKVGPLTLEIYCWEGDRQLFLDCRGRRWEAVTAQHMEPFVDDIVEAVAHACVEHNLTYDSHHNHVPPFGRARSYEIEIRIRQRAAELMTEKTNLLACALIETRLF
jgi:hypothetical protein